MSTTVGILGTGLMGGSLGLALSKAGIDRRVGFDLDDETLRAALDKGAITHPVGSPKEAVNDADFVFVATPVSTIASIVTEVSPALKPGAVVTDVGSTKLSICDQLGALLGGRAHFIGGHPIAGSEQEGIEAADEALFDGAYWILTPTQQTDPAAYGSLVRLLGKLSVKVISLDPARHDETVALSSHLPQVLSSSFMEFAAQVAAEEQGIQILAAGGFRDLTRIAASSPDLWVPILRENRQALLELLNRFILAISNTRSAIDAQDWDEVQKMLASARKARIDLPGKPGIASADLVEITLPVPDRPGVLAEVTTTVGEAGVNIEDIDIVHSAEGGRGTIHLTVDGMEAAKKASDAIAGRGYRPEITR